MLDSIIKFLETTGIARLFAMDPLDALKTIVMFAIAFVLVYLAIVKKFEPLLLLPIAIGMLLGNLPGANLFHLEFFIQEDISFSQVLHDGGFLDLLYLGVKLGIYPSLIFIGIGAMTDFTPLISNPKSLVIGAGAQLGVFVAFFGAYASGFFSLFEAVNAMAEKYDMPILYSCHPRSRKRLESSGFVLDPRVIAHEPLGFHDFNCLQMHAYAVISDSGTLPEESSFYTSIGKPFPAVCIRTSTERPEALDKGCFVLAGIDEKSLLQAVDTAVQMHRDGQFGIPVPDYTDENVSAKVVRLIQSYTGVVNKMVWRKD